MSGVFTFELTELQAAAVAAQLHHLDQVYASNYPVREEMLRIGIGLMLHTVNVRYQLRFERQTSALFGVVLTNCFINLICQHYLQSRCVSDYANRLAVKPNHLNETVKHTTGTTCSELIKTMMILETKIMLRQTNKSIEEIADVFNFQDFSHFTKYTGLTPVGSGVSPPDRRQPTECRRGRWNQTRGCRARCARSGPSFRALAAAEVKAL